MADAIRLSADDPTVFAKCPKCCKTGTGTKAGSTFMRAYTRARFARKPKCENCKTPMVRLYELKEDRREPKRQAARRNGTSNRDGAVRGRGVHGNRQLLRPANARA